jgi:RimJ/RimL family protein N-acetyltransferase
LNLNELVIIRDLKMNEKKDEKGKLVYIPFIEGENVGLAPTNLDHIHLYTKWNNNPKARQYARNMIPRTTEDIKKWHEPKGGLTRHVGFEIWHKKDKVPIGTCGFGRIDWVDRNANIYMTIGEPKYWNKNLGTEASHLLIDYGFKELNFIKIYAGIFEPNIRSWSVAEKDGFVLEGIQKKDIYIDGEYVDARKYRLFKEDWLNRKT